MKIGFIGAGKVGFSLGKYFCEHNMEVSGYYSKNPHSALMAAEFTGTNVFNDVDGIVEASDTLFLTVPDGAIGEVWDYIGSLPIRNKIICHCSGSLSSLIFSNIDNHDAFGYSIHPVLGISDKFNSYKQLNSAFFTLEGTPEKLGEMETLIRQLGNPLQVISPENKGAYHSAAVFAGNFMLALLQTGIDLLKSCGFNEESASLALKPLMEGTMRNVAGQGRVQALTGPVERCDIETVERNMACLSEKDRQLYVLLSQKLLVMAKEKRPENNYSGLERTLEEAYEKYSRHI
ncbi:NADP oxidoreductase coenzyme F420-dependent [Ruminiclostridium hungatei]|uniref:NADP oxidoreductase coenzyme F420-dependent n=1 Tax=Ruminiclostridium hungatei TaxID=48256 RepID=A0A1V4SRD7_RUMHU|nr:Rossmann-like and DUF2520 domain-containing protein [Ruminiclostridium hungatei]OPX46016.1 NADP oxidoreductase coenzyme F420-dependent [Ruminiclostridium hungatei]